MKKYTLEEFVKIPTLHELVSIALEDLERVEKDSKYKIDMSNWHSSHEDVCYVCLAGSCMTRFLKPEDEWTTHDLRMNLKNPYSSDSTDILNRFDDMMYALNNVRTGDLYSAVYNFYDERPESAYELNNIIGMPLYEDDKEGFKLKLKEAISQLKELNL